MEKKEIVDLIRRHIERVESSKEGKELLKRLNQTIQFKTKEREHFHIIVQDGHASVRVGEKKVLDFANRLLV